MIGLLRALALVIGLARCASVPIEEHECYASVLDYLRGNRKTYCNDVGDGDYQLFRKSKPVVAKNLVVTVTYVGDLDGRGYCLTPSYGGKVTLRGYCTLYGESLDACIFSDVVNGKPRTVVSLRRESPSCNGQPWNVLETVFEQTRIDFLEGESGDTDYMEAAERVRGN